MCMTNLPDSAEPLRFSWRGSAAPFLYRGGHATGLYERLYYKLFAAMADAVESLEQGEPAAARKVLNAAMLAAEEAVLSAPES